MTASSPSQGANLHEFSFLMAPPVDDNPPSPNLEPLFNDPIVLTPSESYQGDLENPVNSELDNLTIPLGDDTLLTSSRSDQNSNGECGSRSEAGSKPDGESDDGSIGPSVGPPNRPPPNRPEIEFSSDLLE